MTSPGRRSTKREIHGGALLAALLLAACTGGRGVPSASQTPPASGPRVVLPSGAVFALEVARTPEQTAQGLMFRESLAPASGMVFLFDAPRPQSFWMKNCHFALDVVFTEPSGAQKTVPAFWAGGKQWKVRYSSPVVGLHRYRTQCNDTGDAGSLDHLEGRHELSGLNATGPG